MSRRVGYRLRRKYAARRALFEALANKVERRERPKPQPSWKITAFEEIVKRIGAPRGRH